MLERDLLLSLMRRVRRRRRWTAALEGGTLAVTVGALALAATVATSRRVTGTMLGVGQLSATLLVLFVIGATARALRRIPLHTCARAVDRVIAACDVGAVASSANGGDCVLAAVSLIDTSRAPTPFVAALVADAAARVMRTDLRLVVPAPRARALALAAGAMALLVVSGLARFSRSGASGHAVATNETRLSVAASEPRIRLDGATLDAEFEELRRARAAGRDANDVELARLADDFQNLLADLSNSGLGAAVTVMRIQGLVDAARAEADQATAARTATAAARSASNSARYVGNDGTALANALSETAPESDNVPNEAADRLASHGESGRTALGEVAEAAATALANAGIGTGIGIGTGVGTRPGSAERGDSGDVDDQPRARRLAHPSDSSSRSNQPRSTDRRPRSDERHLEQLRRDLDATATACRNDPKTCQRRAENTGHALTELQHEGRTAEARKRLSQALDQLLERLRRTGAASGDPEQLRRFVRSARGLGLTQPGSALPPTPANVHRKDGNRTGETRAESVSTTNDEALSNVVPSVGAGGETEGSATATTGGGIGSEPGGRVRGARSPGGTGAGRDAPTTLRTDSPGPSRAEIIGGGAARGFASTAYRQVFADYHAAVEESLDATSVAPGRRYLVRRYFQLIRPRTND